MGSIYDYVKKYGDVSFKDKEFNVIDSMIFSAITYIDFTNIVGKDRVNLSFALRNFLCTVSLKDYIRSGFFEKDIIKLSRLLAKSKRYSEVEVKCVSAFHHILEFQLVSDSRARLYCF